MSRGWGRFYMRDISTALDQKRRCCCCYCVFLACVTAPVLGVVAQIRGWETVSSNAKAEVEPILCCATRYLSISSC